MWKAGKYLFLSENIFKNMFCIIFHDSPLQGRSPRLGVDGSGAKNGQGVYSYFYYLSVDVIATCVAATAENVAKLTYALVYTVPDCHFDVFLPRFNIQFSLCDENCLL